VKKIGILYHPKVPATRTRAREIETEIKLILGKDFDSFMEALDNEEEH